MSSDGHDKSQLQNLPMQDPVSIVRTSNNDDTEVDAGNIIEHEL